MAKRRKNGQMSDEELEVRRHHSSLRRLKANCSDENVELKDYESANPDDMCVLSLSDVDSVSYTHLLWTLSLRWLH